MEHNQQETYLTRHSLIHRLKTTSSHQAWEEFMFHYRPFIFFLLAKMDINLSEQDDLFQEIMLKLFQNLKSYSRAKGRFRSWLGTVIRNCVLNYLRDQKKLTDKTDVLNENLQLICTGETEELEQTIQEEWHNYVMDLALQKLSRIFDENIIRCFKMTLAGEPPEKIANELNIAKESVYTLRSRFKTRLTAEIRQIIENLEF